MQKNPRLDNIKTSLTKLLQKLDQYALLDGSCSCVFILAGNSFRSDDGAGPYIAEKLISVLDGLPSVYLINAKTNPENYIDEVSAFSPEYVVFLDAANFGAPPGEFIFIDDETALPQNSASTHTLPLNLIAALIRAQCGCSVMYIGIQAGSLMPGDRLSKEVKRAADLFVKEVSARLTEAENA